MVNNSDPAITNDLGYQAIASMLNFLIPGVSQCFKIVEPVFR